MWLWTRQEAKQIDELSIKSGIPAERLMETAGQNMASRILRRMPALAQTITVLCGPGNNGGDGFVVARELSRKGLDVTVVADVDANSSPLCQKKRAEFKGRLISIAHFLEFPKLADVWIDALFGIGLNRDLDSKHEALLNRVNRLSGFKIALDTPSGLNVDTGSIFKASFRADLTFTVGNPKPGFYLNSGPEACGKILRVEAGFPSEISEKEARSVFLLSAYWAHRWLPVRRATDNKTRGGRTLIWAGSSKMPGAAVLAAEAASRVGSGYVYASEKTVLKFRPEIIRWSGDLSSMNAVLVGPGLGVKTLDAKNWKSLMKASCPVVVDADALTLAASMKVQPFRKNWVATPHAGELSRFLPLTAKEIEADRLKAARTAQDLLQCTVVLKGFHTVVALPDFSVIVPTGNVALAKGGSGDVLGGMIAGFLSQGVSSDRATLLATYLHGKVADEWVRRGLDVLSLTPTDLIQELPKVIGKLRSF